MFLFLPGIDRLLRFKGFFCRPLVFQGRGGGGPSPADGPLKAGPRGSGPGPAETAGPSPAGAAPALRVAAETVEGTVGSRAGPGRVGTASLGTARRTAPYPAGRALGPLGKGRGWRARPGGFFPGKTGPHQAAPDPPRGGRGALGKGKGRDPILGGGPGGLGRGAFVSGCVDGAHASPCAKLDPQKSGPGQALSFLQFFCQFSRQLKQNLVSTPLPLI
jgi:hypothetical protein